MVCTPVCVCVCVCARQQLLKTKGENKFAAVILFIILSLLNFTGDTAGINWDEAPAGHNGNAVWSFHCLLFCT